MCGGACDNSFKMMEKNLPAAIVGYLLLILSRKLSNEGVLKNKKNDIA